MARIEIDMPKQFLFITEYPVLATDINAANHMGMDRFLTVVIESQMRLFRHLGFEGGKIDEGVGYITVDTGINYLGEVRYGDLLDISVTATEFGNKNFDLVYLFEVNDKKVALIKTGILCFDYEQGKPVPVPESFKARFQ